MANAAKLAQAQALCEGMTPDELHETMRGLLAAFYEAPRGLDKAIQATAVAHFFYILDVMLSAGHPLPSAWTQRPAHDTNAG